MIAARAAFGFVRGFGNARYLRSKGVGIAGIALFARELNQRNGSIRGTWKTIAAPGCDNA